MNQSVSPSPFQKHSDAQHRGLVPAPRAPFDSLQSSSGIPSTVLMCNPTTFAPDSFKTHYTALGPCSGMHRRSLARQSCSQWEHRMSCGQRWLPLHPFLRAFPTCSRFPCMLASLSHPYALASGSTGSHCHWTVKLWWPAVGLEGPQL